MNERTNEQTRLTSRFFSATKTLGAETTAMTSSSPPPAPSSSSLARREAVSSEYCGRARACPPPRYVENTQLELAIGILSVSWYDRSHDL